MEPVSPQELQDLAASSQRDERLEFARQIGNHQINPYLLRQAIIRTAREYYIEKGIPEAQIARALPILPAPPPDWRGLPTKGNIKIFALLIDFPDENHFNSATTINDGLFGAPASGAPYESLTRYYQRSSNNLLTFSGTTLGWFRSAVRRQDVPQTDAGREALIMTAINHFKANGHDFRQYDNDHDGVIDYFLVLWSGPDNGWGHFWWGYQPYFSNTGFTVDGLRLGKYSWQWECRPVRTNFGPRTCIHETGHALGLPDLYDYNGDYGPDGGVGGLDMMDGTLYDHNCFSKWVLEWLSPTVIADGLHTQNLNPAETTGNCVMMWPGISSGEIFSEFFMVENRQRLGNDTGLMNEGLLIWHIDAHLNASGTNYVYDNSYAARKLVRLMERDGLEDIEAGRGANAGDFYIPGTSFSPTTFPSSVRYDGKPSNVSVMDITAAGDQITCACEVKDRVAVYTNFNYTDAYQILDPGRYDLSQLTIGNDAVRSLKVPAGWRVTLFEHAGFQGVKKVVLDDMPALPGFDRTTSSIIVEEAVLPVVYEHADYLGRFQVLNAGSYNLGQLILGNDIISSVKVPPGWRVTLYEHADYQGQPTVLTASIPLVPMNDCTSSIQVEKNVFPVVYEHNDYGGRFQVLDEGRYDLAQLSIGNDIISSVKVPSGWIVRLYEHAGFLGETKTLTADTTALPTFNDRASSIVVEKYRVVPNVIGHLRRTAEASVRSAGLTPVITNPSITNGFVRTQSPKSGKHVLPGSVVRLTLRSEPDE